MKSSTKTRVRFPIEDLEAIEAKYDSVTNVDDYNPMLIALQKKIGVDVTHKAYMPKKHTKKPQKIYTHVNLPEGEELYIKSLLKQGYNAVEISKKTKVSKDTIRRIRMKHNLCLIPLFKFQVNDIYLTSLSCLMHWNIKVNYYNRAEKLTKDAGLKFSTVKVHWGEMPIGTKYMLSDDTTIYTKDTVDYYG